MSFFKVLEQRDPITADKARDRFERMGMSIIEAKACFDRVAYLQKRLEKPTERQQPKHLFPVLRSLIRS